MITDEMIGRIQMGMVRTHGNQDAHGESDPREARQWLGVIAFVGGYPAGGVLDRVATSPIGEGVG